MAPKVIAAGKPHLCIDMLPRSPRELIARAERAWSINPQNKPPPEAAVRAAMTSALCLTGTGCETAQVELTRAAMAGLTTKFWKVGQEVTFGFLRASSQIATHARNGFAEVGRYANLKFREAAAAQAMVRVADYEQGAWSYLGTDCLGVARGQQTMNLARSWADFATAVHEICHAVGMVHEHQSPAAPEDLWNEAAVYRYYSGPPNNWPREQIKSNVIDRYSSNQTQFTTWDRKSIMLYPLDASLLKNPALATGWNRELSATDRAFLGKTYPFPDAPPPPPPPPATVEITIPQAGVYVLKK